MAETNHEPRSLVSVDVGSVRTRAQLFDAVEGSYHLIASCDAPSTLGAPVHDINVGVLEAIEQIETLTGRYLLDEQGQLIPPNGDEEHGAHALSATLSGGPPLKVIIMGLLDTISLESARRLLRAHYCRIVASFSLRDRRRPEAIADAIAGHLPDLVVIAGGTNRGASRSVLRLANYLALALELLPKKHRPELLYVGNEKLHSEMEGLLAPLGNLHTAANIRPALDVEDLAAAGGVMNSLYAQIQARKLLGLDHVERLAGGHFLPTSVAFGRTIRFLSLAIDAPKGVLGIDIGASNTTVAAAFGGKLMLNAHTDLGLGEGLSALLEKNTLAQIARWIPLELAPDQILDYLHNKTLIPQSLPATEEDLAIEQAAARQVIRLALGESLSDFPHEAIYPLPGSAPWFDRILISGNGLTRAPRLLHSLLMVLDSIQPVGIASFILDQNNLASAVGGAAEINPELAIQVLESNSFINLGTAVSPVGRARPGSAILRIQLLIGEEREPVIEIKAGSILNIPLPHGKPVDIYLEPLQNTDIGLGPGRGGWVRRVLGGKFGLIVDARGRPLQVPAAASERRELLNTWQHSLSEM